MCRIVHSLHTVVKGFYGDTGRGIREFGGGSWRGVGVVWGMCVCVFRRRTEDRVRLIFDKNPGHPKRSSLKTPVWTVTTTLFDRLVSS